MAVALVCFFAAAAIAALSTACGTTRDDVAAPAEGGADDGAVVVGTCPGVTSAPAAGGECILPEGTTCDFGLCGSRLARCTRGVWAFAGNPAPRPVCPALAPNEGTKCPDCWKKDVVCSYGSTDCTLPDASDNRSVASCADGGWVVEFEPCRDAGPDVQGDGGPDAD
jgi:hypothetical protein